MRCLSRSLLTGALVPACCLILSTAALAAESGHEFNGPYTGQNLSRVAFPVGGLGAGMFSIDGNGAISHFSIRNRMEFLNEPYAYAAVCVLGSKDKGNVARVLEGPLPEWKYFGMPDSGLGNVRTTYGLPRFDRAEFLARFPFASIQLRDGDVPLEVELMAWSPFTPPDADSSSLPVGAIEYRFRNPTQQKVKAVFSFNMMALAGLAVGGGPIGPIDNGFVLTSPPSPSKVKPETFAVFIDGDKATVDHCWFSGSWWDPLTLAWNAIESGEVVDSPPVADKAPGASLFVPFEVAPGGEKTIRLLACWYAPQSNLSYGKRPAGTAFAAKIPDTYVPWYSTRFRSLQEVAEHWRRNYDDLRRRSAQFRDTFYDTTLPPEVIEAVAANLTILKSPTVLRQHDGRMWCWEGCRDNIGSCAGSCTHVWNYAQATCHLFPSMEQSLRQTEYHESLEKNGRQNFRANLPIAPGMGATGAADGQLGGIMKVYREWRIAGDPAWLNEYWPLAKRSLDYCITKFDPRHTGLLEEVHHNTYDIEYYGPDCHCGTIYLGALRAAIEMGQAAGDNVSLYRELLEKGRKRLESELFQGEYFTQHVQKEGLSHDFQPIDPGQQSLGHRRDAEKVNEQGPKYQYGAGCLSDGVLGMWLAKVCGLDGDIVDPAKIRSHLLSVYRYNLRRDLRDHANVQRPGFAMGSEGGLLLCSWPHGGKPLLPFVYSDEVWTGIEYQVASHLMMVGCVDEGLEIVRLCRKRYDGARRNPFNEYECGHWYGRAMSSYGLLQGLTGVRYDAVTKTLYVHSQVGPFRSFVSTATGYGTVDFRDGKVRLEVTAGTIPVEKTVVK